MRRYWISAASLAAFTAFAAPAHGATIILLPEAGAMDSPKVIVSSDGDRNTVYVCASLAQLASGKCIRQRGPTRRR
ncbi:MAG: hypothetical protein E6G94_12160 [Alphaproteobacteria bacterium]|nr:MAG: hypothetical protein E6G94_12160 [Alphaproteobacteria bacterium]